MPAHHCAGAGNDHLHIFFQIAAAADDLLDLTAADIGAADAQLVCSGVGPNLYDLAHDDAVKLLAQIVHALYLHGRHGQIVCKTGKIHIVGQFYEILDPI